YEHIFIHKGLNEPDMITNMFVVALSSPKIFGAKTRNYEPYIISNHPNFISLGSHNTPCTRFHHINCWCVTVNSNNFVIVDKLP
ncbi:MAG: hypothetical protein AAF063_38480, partial [Cyanobacteria bacterium J06643_5]